MSVQLHVQWPRDRFYWAVLQAPPCRGELPAGLEPALEDEIPADHLHAVCTPTDDGRVVICAIPRPALAELDANVLSLTPDSTPEFAAAAPEDLNLLVGSMEPRPIRRARFFRQCLALAALAAATGLICLGLVRRQLDWDASAASAREAQRQVIAAALPGGTDLARELARRKQAQDPALQADADAAVELSKLLAAWPARTPSKPLSLRVSPSDMSFAVCIEGDPASFARAFAPPAGWTLEEPHLNAAGTLTRLNFQLRPASGARHE